MLEQLAGFYAGQRVVLIWDGLSAHWSTKMRAFLDSQRDWLRAERLPAYAPELNPVEGLWANLKNLDNSSPPVHRRPLSSMSAGRRLVFVRRYPGGTA